MLKIAHPELSLSMIEPRDKFYFDLIIENSWSTSIISSDTFDNTLIFYFLICSFIEFELYEKFLEILFFEFASSFLLGES